MAKVHNWIGMSRTELREILERKFNKKIAEVKFIDDGLHLILPSEEIK